MKNLKNLKSEFFNPSTEFRSSPFWAWNGKLEKNELNWQIQDMRDRGMGGFFMHTREGLETEYLGKEFMEHIKESVETAKKLEMTAWLYDEDRWPSGMAGGRVSALGDVYRCKGLTLEVSHDDYNPMDESVIALFYAKLNGMSLLQEEQLDHALSHRLHSNKEEVHLIFRIEISEKSEWFNNEAPPDNLNPDTVKAFIESTYEVYKSTIGTEFGQTVKGIFTDEPSVNDRHTQFTPGRGWIPWTYGFNDVYESKRKYSILKYLPYIFFDGEHSSMIRHDYWRTVTELFSESYAKQLGEWCEDNGLAFTGHFLNEHILGVATRVSGAIMPNYRYQHIPGIDILKEQTDETITIKQCASVVNQYGRKRMLSETYGCTGWEFTFEGQKWVGDFQFVLGVNMVSQHLALYTIRGCRKRDYPPVFGYHTSWWKYNNIIEDYFARLSRVLTEGEVIRDVLILHPASTAWSMQGTNPDGFKIRSLDRDIPKINEYGSTFNKFLRYMLGSHYDFDLGDEIIMEETGRIKGQKFFVNLVGYHTVVIPSIKSMFKSTYYLLESFLKAGGQVVAVEPLPTMIEGRLADQEMQELFSHKNMRVVSEPFKVPEELNTFLPRKISIKNEIGEEAQELLYMLRKIDEDYILFVINNDRERSIKAKISLEGIEDLKLRKGMRYAEEWDPLSGKTSVVELSDQGSIDADFGPADSKLYYIRNSANIELQLQNMDNQQHHKKEFYAALGPTSHFTRDEPNSLILDRSQYRIRDEAWSDQADVWKCQKEIRERLGMRAIYYNGIPQRYKWIYSPHEKNGTPVEFKFEFHVTSLPQTDVYLVLENAKDFNISLNTQSINNDIKGWYIDKSFDKVLLRGMREGTNELILSCNYENRMEVEDCYIIGDFGVDTKRSIVKEPHTLQFGDWGLQGYFHYSGSMTYHFDEIMWASHAGHRAIIELGEYSAVTIEIRINGQTAGHVPWKAANKVDITQWLREGSNQIDIEVMGSPRNLFGPFHQSKGKTETTSWESFRTEGIEYTQNYITHPYGLFEQIKVYRVI